MQTTTNYNLNKPESADYVLVEELNANMDTIDAKLKELETEGGGSVTVDTAISSTSENPVQNKVIEKYLEPVLGKPQESGVPTVNLTGSKYPINDVADGGKRFRFVAYNENDGGVTYCEIVLNTNVGSRVLKLGFYKNSDESYLPFIQQTSTGFDNLPAFNVTLGRYDIDGSTTNTQGAYQYNWSKGYNSFVRASTSSSSKFNIPGTTNPPSTVMFSYRDVLSMTHLAMLEGELYTGEGVSYNGDNLYGDTPPMFVSISECNVTYNGSTATSPWEQIQEDVAELKAKPDYTLPVASASTLGGVKVGDGLSITTDGVLSSSGGGGTGGGFSTDWKTFTLRMVEFEAYPEDGETHALAGTKTPTFAFDTNGVALVPTFTIDCYLNQTGLDATKEYSYRSTNFGNAIEYDATTMNIPDNYECKFTQFIATDNGTTGYVQFSVERSGATIQVYCVITVTFKGSGEFPTLAGNPMYPMVYTLE